MIGRGGYWLMWSWFRWIGWAHRTKSFDAENGGGWKYCTYSYLRFTVWLSPCRLRGGDPFAKNNNWSLAGTYPVCTPVPIPISSDSPALSPLRCAPMISHLKFQQCDMAAIVVPYVAACAGDDFWCLCEFLEVRIVVFFLIRFNVDLPTVQHFNLETKIDWLQGEPCALPRCSPPLHTGSEDMLLRHKGWKIFIFLTRTSR